MALASGVDHDVFHRLNVRGEDLGVAFAARSRPPPRRPRPERDGRDPREFLGEVEKRLRRAGGCPRAPRAPSLVAPATIVAAPAATVSCRGVHPGMLALAAPSADAFFFFGAIVLRRRGRIFRRPQPISSATVGADDEFAPRANESASANLGRSGVHRPARPPQFSDSCARRYCACSSQRRSDVSSNKIAIKLSAGACGWFSLSLARDHYRMTCEATTRGPPPLLPPLLFRSATSPQLSRFLSPPPLPLRQRHALAIASKSARRTRQTPPPTPPSISTNLTVARRRRGSSPSRAFGPRAPRTPPEAPPPNPCASRGVARGGEIRGFQRDGHQARAHLLGGQVRGGGGTDPGDTQVSSGVPLQVLPTV